MWIGIKKHQDFYRNKPCLIRVFGFSFFIVREYTVYYHDDNLLAIHIVQRTKWAIYCLFCPLDAIHLISGVYEVSCKARYEFSRYTNSLLATETQILGSMASVNKI
jgi:hypothetical protein